MSLLRVRDIIEEIQIDEEIEESLREEAKHRELSSPVVVENGGLRIEEIDVEAEAEEKQRRKQQRRKNPTVLESIQEIKSFDSLDLGESLDVLGRHYFTARTSQLGLWQHDEPINWIDLVWLRCARLRCIQKPLQHGEPIMPVTKLIQGVRQCLSIGMFGTEMLRYLDESALLERIRGFWFTIETLKDNDQSKQLIRLCTRFISAVAYVRVHVVGPTRQTRMVRRTQSEEAALAASLDAMVQSVAKDIPDEMQDAMQAEVTTCMLPVDASSAYALDSKQLGIYAGSAEDIDTVAAASEELDNVMCSTLCTYVPWPQKDKPKPKLDAKTKWLAELWHLHIFTYLFHSVHCGQSGAWTAVSQNILEAGLFSAKYLVTWWRLLQPQGLAKLQCHTRCHAPALPLIIQAGNNHWWVRSESELAVCFSFGSAAREWYSIVARDHKGQMEDCIPVSMGKVCGGIIPLPVPIAVPPPPAQQQQQHAPHSNALVFMSDDD